MREIKEREKYNTLIYIVEEIINPRLTKILLYEKFR